MRQETPMGSEGEGLISPEGELLVSNYINNTNDVYFLKQNYLKCDKVKSCRPPSIRNSLHFTILFICSSISLASCNSTIGGLITKMKSGLLLVQAKK